MPTSFYHSLLLALSLMGVSQFVLAADYSWHISSNPGFGSFSSPTAACQAYIESTSQRFYGVSKNSENNFSCLRYNQAQDGSVLAADTSRDGDSCPSDSTYNSETGECEKPEPNECEAKIGQTHEFGGDMGQMEICVDSCIVVVNADSTSPITTYKKDASEKTYWWVTGVFSGESCSTSNSGDTSSPAPTTASSDNECTPTTSGEDGTQTSSCTETKVEIDNRACVANPNHSITINGVMQCVAASKGPKASETKTTTKSETKTNADNSKTETTTKTTEKKSCSGTASCSTNSTTNVNHNTTNSDGTKGSESSSCSGSDCAGSIGTGDGEGDGDGEGEGEEEGDGPAGPEGTLQKGETGDFSEGITEWDQRITDVRSELDQKLDQYTGQFKGVFDLNLSSGSGSLPCDNIPVSFGATTTNLRFCLADYSDPLSYLRYALLLGAAALAAIIILRG